MTDREQAIAELRQRIRTLQARLAACLKLGDQALATSTELHLQGYTFER